VRWGKWWGSSIRNRVSWYHIRLHKDRRISLIPLTEYDIIGNHLKNAGAAVPRRVAGQVDSVVPGWSVH
jgi:hypothetical protein